MVFDPARTEGLNDDVVALYRRAEMYLIEVIRRALIRTGESPTWAEPQLLAIRQERGNIEGMADALHQRLGTTWRSTIDAAYLRGQIEAEKELAALPEHLRPTPATPVFESSAAVYALVSEAITTMEPVHRNLVRRVDDIWRRIGVEATGYSVTGAMTTQQAAQRAFTRMAREGLPFFVDKAGRKWGLDTYAEMAVRTATNKALRAGHTNTMVEHGIDLVVVSSHKNPAPQCAPFERKVLSLTGQFAPGTHRIGDNIVSVASTMQQAEESGLHHPNAILGGDQAIDTFAGAVGASKCAYAGPAFTIRTAKGNVATVSPKHPVLTNRGWRTAESLRAGDYVFNTGPGQRSSTGVIGQTNLEDVPTTVEDEFVSLKNRGVVTRIPAAGHNFNDDRQFLKGEIDVVVTDDCLLPVPDTEIVKETGEVRFVWPDMGRGSEVCDSPLALSGGGIFSSVGRALSNFDTSFRQSTANSGFGRVEYGGELLAGHSAGIHGDKLFHVDLLVPALDWTNSTVSKAFANRRAGDSQNPADVCVAVPGPVETDYIVSVDRISFSGHAYDFQTADGIYSINGIISHNCRHTHSAYIPGYTRISDAPYDGDDTGYKATQKQRYYERQVRASKRMEQAAIDETDVRAARQRTRAYQAKLRDHVAEHDLPRRRHREQLRKPASGAVGLSFDD